MVRQLSAVWIALPLTAALLATLVALLALLAGLLAAALLLTRLLTRVLVLLTRIVLIGHRKSPLVRRSRGQRCAGAFVAGEHRFPLRSFRGRAMFGLWRREPCRKTSSVQANLAAARAVAAPGSHC